MIDYQNLTSKQLSTMLYQFSSGKRWTEKKRHILGIVNNILKQNQGLGICEAEMFSFYRCLIDEENRRKREFFHKSQTGEIQSNFTPADKLNNGFVPVEEPMVGQVYHLSWAFRGAKFRLKSIEGDICYLDNPKYKRGKKGLIQAKVSDLRHLRKYSEKIKAQGYPLIDIEGYENYYHIIR